MRIASSYLPFQFYPEATFGRMEGDRFITCLEQYNAEIGPNFMTALSVDSDNRIAEAQAAYYIANNDKLGIDAMKQVQGDFDWTYEFSDPEDYGNGIIVYQMDTIYDGSTTTTHFLYYQLDDKYTVEICISGFIGSGYLQTSDELYEEFLKVLEFYRTEENMFILVDPETTEVMVTE